MNLLESNKYFLHGPGTSLRAAYRTKSENSSISSTASNHLVGSAEQLCLQNVGMMKKVIFKSLCATGCLRMFGTGHLSFTQLIDLLTFRLMTFQVRKYLFFQRCIETKSIQTVKVEQPQK